MGKNVAHEWLWGTGQSHRGYALLLTPWSSSMGEVPQPSSAPGTLLPHPLCSATYSPSHEPSHRACTLWTIWYVLTWYPAEQRTILGIRLNAGLNSKRSPSLQLRGGDLKNRPTVSTLGEMPPPFLLKMWAETHCPAEMVLHTYRNKKSRKGNLKNAWGARLEAFTRPHSSRIGNQRYVTDPLLPNTCHPKWISGGRVI